MPRRSSLLNLDYSSRQGWVLVQLTGEELKLLRENGKAVRIYKTHSDQAIERQEESLGIGFETADEIAKNVGIPKESLSRASTGIDHVLLNGTRFLSRNPYVIHNHTVSG